MSDRPGGSTEGPARGTPTLPPAAFDISRYRIAADLAARRPMIVPVLLVVFVLAVIGVVAGLVVAGGAGALNAGTAVAIGVASTGVLLALLVVLPAQLAARRRREHARDASVFRMAAASGLSEHLSSIGYAVPTLITTEWVDSPDSEATVPLVHDSVIAARWWRPAPDDDRIFVEPHLRRGETLSSLPALPPLQR